jgi:WS/DGAT C-terminal domain
LGVTINDMMLAISAGALRKLLLRYDGHADNPLLASVPVSFDFSPDRISGNYFTGVLVALPTDCDDLLDRVRNAREAALSAKESHNLLGPELVSRWSAYFPPAPAEALFRWLSNKDGQNKVLNLPISNVPGPQERGRVGGALVTELYSVGPLTAGSGLNITVWSYVDQAQHLGAVRRVHPGGPSRADRCDDRRIRRNPSGCRASRRADGRRNRRGAVVGHTRDSGPVRPQLGHVFCPPHSEMWPTAQVTEVP